jgi:hypothetical protein
MYRWLKEREIVFYAGKTHNRPFRGVFRGGKDFVTHKLSNFLRGGQFMCQKSRGPLEKSQETADDLFFLHTKKHYELSESAVHW